MIKKDGANTEQGQAPASIPTELSTEILQIAEQLMEIGSSDGLSTDDAREPLTFGKFQLLDCLHRGGQAVALLAFDPDLERQVVIKLYHHGVSPEQKLRLEREGKALAKIDSPYVAKCLAVEDFSGQPALIIEYISGMPLNDLSDLPMEPHRALQITNKIAKGVGAIHQQGLLHRDLKPSNVIVTSDDVPKIIDFGLTQPIGDIQSSEASGTPAFMPPERARNDFASIDQRSDIFGVGAILFYLLTGRPPFPAEDSKKARTAAAKGQVDFPQSGIRKIGKPIVDFCMNCLQVKPDDRFSNTQELIDAVPAAPKTDWRKWAIAAVALLVVLSAAVAFRNFRSESPPRVTNNTVEASLPNNWDALINQLETNDLTGWRHDFAINHHIESVGQNADDKNGFRYEKGVLELQLDEAVRLAFFPERPCDFRAFTIQCQSGSLSLDDIQPLEDLKNGVPAYLRIRPTSISPTTEFILVEARARQETSLDDDESDYVNETISNLTKSKPEDVYRGIQSVSQSSESICHILIPYRVVSPDDFTDRTEDWSSLLGASKFNELKRKLNERIDLANDLRAIDKDVVLPYVINTEFELQDVTRILQMPVSDQQRIAESFAVISEAEQAATPPYDSQGLEAVASRLPDAVSAIVSILGQDCLTAQRAMRTRDMAVFWHQYKADEETILKRQQWLDDSLGTTNPESWANLRELAVVIKLNQKYQECIEVFAELDERARAALPPADKPPILESQHRIAEKWATILSIEAKLEQTNMLILQSQVGDGTIFDEIQESLDRLPPGSGKLELLSGRLQLMIGKLNVLVEENEKAIWHLERAEEHIARETNPRHRAGSYLNDARTLLALVYGREERFQDAARVNALLIKACENIPGQRDRLDYLLHNHTLDFVHDERFEEAIQPARKRLALHKKFPDLVPFEPIFRTVDLLAMSLTVEGQCEEAIELVNEYLEGGDELTKGSDKFTRAILIKRLALAHFHSDPADEAQINEAQRLLDESFQLMHSRVLKAILTMNASEAFDIYEHLRATSGHQIFIAGDHSPEGQIKQVTRFKGMMSDILSERYRLMALSENHDLRDRLVDVQNRLVEISILNPDDQTKAEQLEADKQLIFEEMANRVSSLEDVRPEENGDWLLNVLHEKLPAGSAIVEFVDVACPPTPDNMEPSMFVAFVIRKDKTSGNLSIRRIEIDEYDKIEEAALLVARYINPYSPELYLERGIESEPVQEANFEDYLALLSAKVWQKIAPELVGCESITICPDGSLALVPFAALPTDSDGKRRVIHDHVIHYADSCKEVAKLLNLETMDEPFRYAILGDVAYGNAMESHQPVSENSLVSEDVMRGDRSWPALMGTRKEIENFISVYSENGNSLVKLTGTDATEDRLVEMLLASTHIQIATHGYTARTIGARLGNNESRFVGRNPMANTGFVLARANRISTQSDAISFDQSFLSAEEILTLDLSHVSLMVLSACHAGAGSFVSGDSLYGVQKAFRLAGTRTTISSLFSVEDNSTVMLMDSFHRHLGNGHSKSQALRQAQLELINSGQYTDPRYWAGWVLYGDGS